MCWQLWLSYFTLGRSIPDIRNKVGINNITYAGNHGIDIVHPDGSKVRKYQRESSFATGTRKMTKLCGG